MSVKCIADKPVRPLEIDLSGEAANMFTLTEHVPELCKVTGFDATDIIFELKGGSLEEAVWIFDYYFGDMVIIYR